MILTIALFATNIDSGTKMGIDSSSEFEDGNSCDTQGKLKIFKTRNYFYHLKLKLFNYIDIFWALVLSKIYDII